MSAKPRGDSKLWTLPEEVQEALYAQLCSGTYEEAEKWLLDSHGVDSSRSALSKFYSKYARLARLRESRSSAEEFKQFLAQRPDITPEQIREYGQIVFELKSAKAEDSEEFIALQRLRLDTEKAERRYEIEKEKLQVSRRRVKLLEEKQAAARKQLDEVVKKGREGGLSEEALKQIEEAANLL